jgi:hypothetical protein
MELTAIMAGLRIKARVYVWLGQFVRAASSAFSVCPELSY